MVTQNHAAADEAKSVVTQPAHPELNPRSEVDFTTRVLALTGVLQTTLEINELMALFAREIGNFVSFDGLSYQFPAMKVDIRLGDQAKHSCEYQLIVANDHLGDLRFFRSQHFTDQELVTIENLLSSLLYPLRNTLLYQRAVNSAVMDPVTGVKNRTAMESALRREIMLAQRQDTPLSIILMDIDHFKSVNDNHGHLCGDQVLRTVAQCAEQSIRESDMLFRYGGEEFLVLLTGTDLQGAELLAERIRCNVAALSPIPEEEIRLTISLGATLLNDEDDGEQLLDRVDHALYQAKEGGRNRVVVI